MEQEGTEWQGLWTSKGVSRNACWVPWQDTPTFALTSNLGLRPESMQRAGLGRGVPEASPKVSERCFQKLVQGN